MGQLYFVTGTDTGVGKTLLTALLLVHLRRHGCHALATKPFCTGPRTDVAILRQAQDHELSRDQINPFHFKLPLAPLVAARKSGKTVPLNDVLGHIQSLAAACEVLLVEGAGGLFVPLGERYSVATVIAALHCPVLLVARNKLGAVNHVLLSLAALKSARAPGVHVALMDQARSDIASKTNPALLEEWIAPAKVECIPFLGPNAATTGALRKNALKLKKSLAGILRTGSFSTAFGVQQQSAENAKKKLLVASVKIGRL